MTRLRASVHPSTTTNRRNGRRWLAFLAATVASVAGMTVLAASASAHDAPPTGTATCATNGPTYDWQVTNGSTFVENTGGEAWKISFTSTAGTVAATGATTGAGDTPTGPGFTVTGIPSTVSSITVSSTLVWGTAPSYSSGTDTHTTTISRPAAGCDQSVPVPGAPTVNAPTCATAGTLVVPSDTASVKWSVAPAYNAGDTGNYTVTATAQSGYFFTGGATTKTFPITVAGQLTGAACDTVVTPVQPSFASTVCSGPGTQTAGTLTVPTTTGVVYTINGTDVSGQTLNETAGTALTVIAKPATGFRFTGPQEVDYPVSFPSAGNCLVGSTPAAPTVAQGECTTAGDHSSAVLAVPTTTGVRYAINGKDVSGQTLTEAVGSTVTIVATPLTGYHFTGAQSVNDVITFASTGSCLDSAAVATPAFSNDQCRQGAPAGSTSYTIPATEHVSYRVNGAAAASGTHPAINGSTITVTATPDSGYTLAGSTSSWTHTFTATPICRDVAAASVHKATPAPVGLASTGVPTSSLLIGGALVVLLGIGFLLAGGVRGRKERS